jgi:hypothetical protein
MAEKPFDVREIANALERVLLDDFGETAAAMLRGFIFRSPVGNPDTWKETSLPPPPGYVGGHFRRNWIVSIGGFSSDQIEGIDNAGSATFASGLAVVEAYKRGKLGVNLVLQNNVPYANRLALGHSKQAQAGWIDEEIANALTIPGGTKDLP